MAAVGRVLLWTVVLVAPGGFLLVPVLAAASLHSHPDRPRTFREHWAVVVGGVKAKLGALQRYWTKS
jgi:hypothetical protein